MCFATLKDSVPEGNVILTYSVKYIFIELISYTMLFLILQILIRHSPCP